MAKHEKFNLDELSKSAVVNKSKGEEDNGVEDFINNAVQEHLKKIAQPPVSFKLNDIKKDEERYNLQENDQNLEEENISDHEEVIGLSKKNYQEDKKSVDDSLEIRNIGEQSSDKEQSNDDALSTGEKNGESADNLDIESIKQQEYKRGYEQAKAELEEQASLRDKVDVSNKELADVLKERLNTIVPEADFNEKVARLSAEAISGIAKKLHLVLPVNFEEIICKGLIDKLNKFYKEGKVTIKIHPERYEYCSQILQSDSIPAKFKDNFKIEQDDKITVDDCSVEWEDTILEYSKEQLSEEIDIIIERLTNAA